MQTEINDKVCQTVLPFFSVAEKANAWSIWFMAFRTWKDATVWFLGIDTIAVVLYPLPSVIKMRLFEWQVPLNCHHGRRVGSVCVCDEGWRTKTTNVPHKELRLIYDWCNVKIKKTTYSKQRALLHAVSFHQLGPCSQSRLSLVQPMKAVWALFKWVS